MQHTPEKLKEILLKELIDRIENGETVMKDGEVVKVDAPAATLNAALAFLKQFPPTGDIPKSEMLGEKLAQLTGRMPFAKPSVTLRQ
jgi:hypothetical protein